VLNKDFPLHCFNSQMLWQLKTGVFLSEEAKENKENNSKNDYSLLLNQEGIIVVGVGEVQERHGEVAAGAETVAFGCWRRARDLEGGQHVTFKGRIRNEPLCPCLFRAILSCTKLMGNHPPWMSYLQDPPGWY
jgi:hypothetical protein